MNNPTRLPTPEATISLCGWVIKMTPQLQGNHTRCHKSIEAAASEDYGPNRLRETEQGQGSISTSLDTNLKSLRVIHLAAGAGPGAGVMRFMLLHPIWSQHWHPGYIYPPHSLTHLVSCRIITWKVCFTHQLNAAQQDYQQLFRLTGSVCLSARNFKDCSGVFFLDKFLIDTALKHVLAHSTHQESSWTECIQRKIISCSL